jgi:hypothetical protein
MRSMVVAVSVAVLPLPAQAASGADSLQGTPWWVYGVFVVLLGLGAQALRPRVVSFRKLLITPAIFIVWGIASLATKAALSPFLVADWLAAALAGGALALATTRLLALQVDRDGGLLQLPGSLLPLARNLLIFATKYVLAVAAAIDPGEASRLAFWDVAVSGLSAGYFIGWVLKLVRVYRAAPTVALRGTT